MTPERRTDTSFQAMLAEMRAEGEDQQHDPVECGIDHRDVGGRVPHRSLTVMEMLPSTGWADVATRQDLNHLTEVLRLEFRADMADGQRRMIQWNVVAIIAALSAMTAILRLG